MTKSDEPAAPPEGSLAALRREIDDIDGALHTLLMERGEIIDRLIAVKARQGGGSAFRPAREAEMMRRLVTRHRGILPLDTVEGIWRIIISTFTYVQAPYSVHADISGGDAAMRDSCRFHFGFTVPLETHASPAAVIDAVAGSPGDLGLVRADETGTAWWEALASPSAPKIIARLPFVERADHAAGLPLFVVAKAPEEAKLSDVLLYAVAASREVLPAASIEIVCRTATNDGVRLMVAAPETVPFERLAKLFAGGRVSYIGSHAARFEIGRRDPSVTP